MTKRRRTVPFSLWPSSWGLEGKRRQEAYAEYYLEGEELERELLDIKCPNKESVEYFAGTLEIDYKYGKIKEHEYNKEKATLKGEPFFMVISGEYINQGGGTGQFTFELDWNDDFVIQLQEEGWEGITDDQIVNAWFDDVNRQMLEEEMGEDYKGPASVNRTRKNRLDNDRSEYT